MYAKTTKVLSICSIQSVPQIVEAAMKNLQQLHLSSPSPSSSPTQTCDRLAWGKGMAIIPLHHNISMHILHTVLYTFLKVLTRRIYSNLMSF